MLLRSHSAAPASHWLRFWHRCRFCVIRRNNARRNLMAMHRQLRAASDGHVVSIEPFTPSGPYPNDQAMEPS